MGNLENGFPSLWWERDGPSMRLEPTCLGPGAGAHTAQTNALPSPTDKKKGSAWLHKGPTAPTPLSRFWVGL